MTRNRLTSIAALLALTLALGACGGDGGDTGAGGNGTGTSPAPTQTAGGGENTVNVIDIAYEPAEITVGVGDTVTWEWTGNLPHSVTADPGQTVQFDSNNLQKGATFQQTFSQAGRYEYYCKVHSTPDGTQQNGVVIVE